MKAPSDAAVMRAKAMLDLPLEDRSWKWLLSPWRSPTALLLKSKAVRKGPDSQGLSGKDGGSQPLKLIITNADKEGSSESDSVPLSRKNEKGKKPAPSLLAKRGKKRSRVLVAGDDADVNIFTKALKKDTVRTYVGPQGPPEEGPSTATAPVILKESSVAAKPITTILVTPPTGLDHDQAEGSLEGDLREEVTGGPNPSVLPEKDMVADPAQSVGEDGGVGWCSFKKDHPLMESLADLAKHASLVIMETQTATKDYSSQLAELTLRAETADSLISVKDARIEALEAELSRTHALLASEKLEWEKKTFQHDSAISSLEEGLGELRRVEASLRKKLAKRDAQIAELGAEVEGTIAQANKEVKKFNVSYYLIGYKEGAEGIPPRFTQEDLRKIEAELKAAEEEEEEGKISDEEGGTDEDSSDDSGEDDDQGGSGLPQNEPDPNAGGGDADHDQGGKTAGSPPPQSQERNPEDAAEGADSVGPTEESAPKLIDVSDTVRGEGLSVAGTSEV